MAYRVSLAAPAEADAYAAFDRIRAAAPLHAEKWLTQLFDTIFSLDRFPTRCPVIPEAKEVGFPARHLLFGKGHGGYRIIFHIHEEDQHVLVLRIWHASRMPSPPTMWKSNGFLSTAICLFGVREDRPCFNRLHTQLQCTSVAPAHLRPQTKRTLPKSRHSW